MYVLGINAYHADASACLLHDGEIVAAAEEERFRRVKHWAGFPADAIRYCLAAASIGVDQLDHIAINQGAYSTLCRTVGFWRKIGYLLARRPDLALVRDRLRNKRERASVAVRLQDAFPHVAVRAPLHYVEHHLAHLASAFLVSPFGDAVVVSLDGFGDFASGAWGVGSKATIEVHARSYFPHSLGVFYQALTQYLGFPHFGDEYKVMGLASYGGPRYLEQMRRVVLLEDDGTFRLNLKYFRHHRENVEYEWDHGAPQAGRLFSPALGDLLGPPRSPAEPLDARHRDIAHSTQAMYEEAFFHLLRALHRRYRLDALALAGGCAMNSVANGRVYAQTPFRRLYVQPAAGDAGGALGAALVVAHAVGGGASNGAAGRPQPMEHAYWGPRFDDDQIERALATRAGEISAQGCRVFRMADQSGLIAGAAAAIARGEVVGWFQGRLEWGPRALGNRSILADPRRADMKNVLNAKIKRRESFRPFAPSILREAVAEWFEVDDDVPFMTQVYPIRPEKRQVVPAVTHVDGSGRLQTVTRRSNPAYYELIERFAVVTGVPMVLNTSFNENEPVVCLPAEALDCFLRTSMDVLVLGSWMITRPS